MILFNNFCFFEVTESATFKEYAQTERKFFCELRDAQQYVTKCIGFYSSDDARYVVEDEYRNDNPNANVPIYRSALIRDIEDMGIRRMFTISRHVAM